MSTNKLIQAIALTIALYILMSISSRNLEWRWESFSLRELLRSGLHYDGSAHLHHLV